MVTKITVSKSIRSVVAYNEKKVTAGKGELLYEKGFPLDPELLSFNNKVAFFRKLTRQNTRAKSNTMHFSINFSPDEHLEADQLRRITDRYMEGVGFGNQPYLVYQHFDAGHPHLHVVTVNIQMDGRRIATHNLAVDKSEKIRKEIEISFGLVKAAGRTKSRGRENESIPLERVVYGQQETTAAVSGIVREVLKTYKFSSLPELNAVLNQFGVFVSNGEPGSRLFNHGGLIYGVLDEHNLRTGFALKASDLKIGATLKYLNRLFARYQLDRRPYGVRIKVLLDEAIAKSKDQTELASMLHRHGLRVVFKQNVAKELVGVMVIDNATRVVFDSRNLGRRYSIDALHNALKKGDEALMPPLQPTRLTTNSSVLAEKNDPDLKKETKVPAMALPVIDQVLETLHYEERDPNELVLQKKKQQQRDIGLSL